MEDTLAQRKPHVRSNSGTSISLNSDNQTEGKSYPYQEPQYEIMLQTNGCFLNKPSIGIDDKSKDLCLELLTSGQTMPQDSLFRDDLFDITCNRVSYRNGARVLYDITPLIVPSAESLFIHGSSHLEILRESINECWHSSIPLSPPRLHPSYSVGFDRYAFSPEQMTKLEPYIGDLMIGDRSFFLATSYMYFPFLTCEVKCTAGSLNVAGLQNAHSMTLAIRAIVKLFRLVGRENELHRQVLAFSISHDNRYVRIYGHYPAIIGKDVRYCRHLIQDYSFWTMNGIEK
ncbi:hypothetical protein ACQKWADRAFT_291716 [Trichoderma austrokoningii]